MTERTRQQRDPTGTLGSNTTGTVLVVVAVLWALVVTAAGDLDPSAFALQATSLFLLMCAAAVFVWSSSPLRAPLDLTAHLAIHGLALSAFSVGAAALWQQGDTHSASWASVSIGLFTVALAPYRPVGELLGFAFVPAAVIGVAAVLESAARSNETPPVAVVVAATVPLLGLAAASARYTSVMLAAVEHPEDQLGAGRDLREAALREGISMAVQRNRADILGREVAPFFARLLAAREITDEDRATAHTIAESIRDVMIAEADRSWLESALLEAGSSQGIRPIVHDPDALVTAMDARQRTALRALVVAIIEEPPTTAFVIDFTRTDAGCCGIIRAKVDLPESATHTLFDPFLAVMRIVFSALAVDFTRPDLIVRFSFVLS